MPAKLGNLALTGGFYQARSIIANAQRCVNLYPEKNPDDSPFPYTMYLTPGLTLLRAGGSTDGPIIGKWRGIYESSTGDGFGVVGNKLYTFNSAWQFVELATITNTRTNPVSFTDNGIDLVMVDGSTIAHVVNLSTFAPSTISTPQNFLGADFVKCLDLYTVFNKPDSREIYCTNRTNLTIDPLDVGSKDGRPDKLQSIEVIHRELWLLGERWSTEVWYNAGASAGSGFPFAINPGVFIEQGNIAKYSVASNDLMLFWLGRDKDGDRTVFMGTKYSAQRISTPAIAQYLNELSTVSDAIGMIYKQQDHVFYVLTFPTANKTIVYDSSEGFFHERTWNDINGRENRIRANCMGAVHETQLAGDHTNGNLYKLDLTKYVDEVNGVNTTPGEVDSVSPIVRRRGFPHQVAEGSKVSYPCFRGHMQAGEAAVDVTNVKVYLRFSDDGGRTWSNPIESTIGLIGEYLSTPEWRQLGMARDRVFELFWDAPVNTALLGAYLQQPIVSAT